jgi:hypothetical protein
MRSDVSVRASSNLPAKIGPGKNEKKPWGKESRWPEYGSLRNRSLASCVRPPWEYRRAHRRQRESRQSRPPLLVRDAVGGGDMPQY